MFKGNNANIVIRCKSILVITLLITGVLAVEELSKFSSSNVSEREKKYQDIISERKNLISELNLLAKQETKKMEWHNSKYLAIMLIGELRAVDSIPILIDNIEYKMPKLLEVPRILDIGGLYPSAESLAKIGMPSIDPVIEKLGSYDKECQGRKNCVWIIKKVLGIKLGRYKLQLVIEETKNEKVKLNLQAVLPVFKTLQEKLDAERARRDKQKAKQK